MGQPGKSIPSSRRDGTLARHGSRVPGSQALSNTTGNASHRGERGIGRRTALDADAGAVPDGQERGAVRRRGRFGSRAPARASSRLFMRVMEPAAFIMTRRTLIGVKQRAEALWASRTGAARAKPGAARRSGEAGMSTVHHGRSSLPSSCTPSARSCSSSMP